MLHLLYGIGAGPCSFAAFLGTGAAIIPEDHFPIGRTTTGDILFIGADASSSPGRIACMIHDEEKDDDGLPDLHEVATGLQEFLAALDDDLLRGPVGDLDVPEAGFTWHLDGDGENALLVASDVHDSVPHLTPRVLGRVARQR